MYGKLFSSIYDGTLVEHWEALITFQQMIVLCDADGVIDITPEALARRTGIPLEHIKRGIEILEKPDKASRTPDEQGKRIVRIDDHRAWGWYIVNHNKYKNLQDSDTVREQNRERKRRQREREKSQDVTQCHAVSRHTDTDTDTNTNTRSQPVERKKTPTLITTFLKQCATNKVDPIPDNDPIFKYATEINLPTEFLSIAWYEFIDRYTTNKKMQKDWRATFRNCVRGNWLKLWWVNTEEQYQLTTAGMQAKKKQEAA